MRLFQFITVAALALLLVAGCKKDKPEEQELGYYSINGDVKQIVSAACAYSGENYAFYFSPIKTDFSNIKLVTEYVIVYFIDDEIDSLKYRKVGEGSWIICADDIDTMELGESRSDNGSLEFMLICETAEKVSPEPCEYTDNAKWEIYFNGILNKLTPLI